MKRLPTALSTNPKSLPARGNSCVRVALDVPLPRLFDYALPEDIEARVGDRVTVPLRRATTNRRGDRGRKSRASSRADRIKPIVRACATTRRAFRSDWLELMRFLSSLLPASARRNRDRCAAAAPALDQAAAEKGARSASKRRPARDSCRCTSSPPSRQDVVERIAASSAASHACSAARRDRQRQDRGLSASHRARAGARRPGAGAGARDQPDAAARSALPRRLSRRRASR